MFCFQRRFIHDLYCQKTDTLEPLVEISGYITCVSIRSKAIQLTVDDGTGAVFAIHWTDNPDGCTFRIGHIVLVRGQPSIYREELQINPIEIRTCTCFIIILFHAVTISNPDRYFHWICETECLLNRRI